MSLPSYDWLQLLAHHDSMRELVARERIEEERDASMFPLRAAAALLTIGLLAIIIAMR